MVIKPNIPLEPTQKYLQSLIPKNLPNYFMDDELATILMQYFYGANQVIEKIATRHSKLFAQRAFYDTLGGYLKYYMIPMSRYSYYAGLVKLKTVKNILDLYDQCKNALNTNGNGWRAPITGLSDFNVQIEPLKIVVRNDEEDTACIQLDMLDERTGEDIDMIVALPRLEPEERGVLGNIWLPFKRKRTFNLQSYRSAFVLLRYFELTTRCYSFQGICQDTFNIKFKEWILENLEVHFGDDVVYPGLGAVLRIVETLRRRNKDTIVFVKTNEKRHKTQGYKVLENRAKQLEKHSDRWLEDVFGTKNKQFLDDNQEETFSQREENRRKKYIYIAIAVAVLLLLFVIALALVIKWRRKRSQTDKPPPGEKRVSICERFRKSLNKDDEEVLLSPESSSIASSHKPKTEELSKKSKKNSKDIDSSSKMDSSSSPSPPQTPKCFALCTRKNSPNKSVSSMDSDIGRESKKTIAESPSTKQTMETPKLSKMGIVGEKKRSSISKKKKKRNDDDTATKPIVGILKKDAW